MYDTVYALEYMMCCVRMHVYIYVFICNFVLSVTGWNNLLWKQHYIFASNTNIFSFQNIRGIPIFHGTLEEYDKIVRWILRCSFSERVPSCGQRENVIQRNILLQGRAVWTPSCINVLWQFLLYTSLISPDYLIVCHVRVAKWSSVFIRGNPSRSHRRHAHVTSNQH
jgi:hypothetical protein